jgi:hypothetical protein
MEHYAALDVSLRVRGRCGRTDRPLSQGAERARGAFVARSGQEVHAHRVGGRSGVTVVARVDWPAVCIETRHGG